MACLHIQQELLLLLVVEVMAVVVYICYYLWEGKLLIKSIQIHLLL